MKDKHKMLKEEEGTLAFVEVEHNDYLYDEDLGDEGFKEEEYDITFGAREGYATREGVDNRKLNTYEFNGRHRSYRGREQLEGLDKAVPLMYTRQLESGESVLNSSFSRMLTLVFMNHLVLEWAKKEEEEGRSYYNQERFDAPFRHSFAGLRSLDHNGYQDSADGIAVRTKIIKRNGRIVGFPAQDVLMNVWSNGRLCSWTSRASEFTRSRDENMKTPTAMNRYYMTMSQGKFNADLSGENNVEVKVRDLLVIFEDYIENYLEKLPDSVRKDEAIAYVEYRVEKIKEQDRLGRDIRLPAPELTAISMYSERFYIEFECY